MENIILIHVQIVQKEMVLAGVMEIADGLMGLSQVSFTPSETTFENFTKCNLGGGLKTGVFEKRLKNWTFKFFWTHFQVLQ